MYFKTPPTAEEIKSMSAADFRRACQDSAAREHARHHASFDAVETQRTLQKFGAPQPRQNERLQQLDAKLAELKQTAVIGRNRPGNATRSKDRCATIRQTLRRQRLSLLLGFPRRGRWRRYDVGLHTHR